ncbi:cell wall hydrolase [Sphingomonas sp. AAP5]|uniref:cell wall hydrolase n=1 Tax=Sphingomonas sp. AAP5 TaxID=1523415 RepID=UPI0019CF74C4|nr:cell wall hydrolase [Sphingomonas sp. AAP5]
MTPFRPPSATLRAIVVAIATLAILAPVLLIRFAPPLVRHHVARSAAQRVVPAAELPPVEPVAFQDLDPDDARAFNASVPFVDGPNPAARPFKLAGDPIQRARAIDCMAAAVLYEAGDDPVGQRAVAQVVINRVRHPAFPKTICGVVFQGAERSTGCQFTFTCDGALARHGWLDAQWGRARETASAALGGAVFKPVGYATHYHTDWVVPYWQSSLDKIAAVNTHLFFRWTGWWGTPPAFNRHVSNDEPLISALAPYSDAHKDAAELKVNEALYVDPVAAATPLPGALPGEENSFLLVLDAKKMTADGFAQLATRTCGDRPYCKVMGWTDKTKLPSALPLQPVQIAALSFSYLRDRAHDYDKALWNCSEFKRADVAQCMKQQIYVPAPRSADGFRLETLPVAERAPGVPAAADGLVGVRRKAEVAPAAKATPIAKPGAVAEGR